MGEGKEQINMNFHFKKRLLFLCFLCGWLLITSCGTIKPVTLNDVRNFRTESPLMNPQFKFDAVVLNSNKFGVTLRKMEVGIGTGETTFAKIKVDEKLKIPAGQELTIPVTLYPSIDEIGKLFKSGIDNIFSSQQSGQLEVRGKIVIQKFIFRKKFSIRESVKL